MCESYAVQLNSVRLTHNTRHAAIKNNIRGFVGVLLKYQLNIHTIQIHHILKRRSVIYQLVALNTQNHSLTRMTKEVMGAQTLSASLLTVAELALCMSEKAACVACGLEAQFHQVNDSSGPAVSDMSTDTMKGHTFVPACETQLNNALLVYKAIRGFEVGTSPSPNAIPTMVLQHHASKR